MTQQVFEALADWISEGVAVDFEALGFDIEVITVDPPADLAN
ncbi:MULTISPECIES: hypothetical protein [Burkholderiaceae]|jgi:hypothetical protein|nr:MULTISPECIES: hypothetical protein [Burkholderiaceae]